MHPLGVWIPEDREEQLYFHYKMEDFTFQNSRRTAWGRRQWKGGKLSAGLHPTGVCARGSLGRSTGWAQRRAQREVENARGSSRYEVGGEEAKQCEI